MNAIIRQSYSDANDSQAAVIGSRSSAGSDLSVLQDFSQHDHPVIPARVVFLTHYIPLYQVRVFQAIARQVQDFQILLSTPIEPNREFALDWGNLNVDVQNTVTLRRRWKHRDHRSGTQFVDPLYVHVPYDTKRRLKAIDPDIVMSLELGARSLGAVRYCENSRAKSILCTYMSEHTEVARGWARGKLRRHLIGRADAITYNGPSCKNYLDGLGADPARLYRLAYAADDRTIHHGEIDRNDAESRNRLLYVGQLSDRKGVLPMLRQVTDYCRANSGRQIEVRLAGNGGLYETIESWECPENLTITLLGNVPPEQLSNEMLQCGATIAPTLADEWLLVVNEALHAGLPVIGSVYAQATTTLIQDGKNGWSYDPANESSLADALDQYFAASEPQMRSMWSDCRDSIAHCTPDWAAAGAVNAIANLVGRERVKRCEKTDG